MLTIQYAATTTLVAAQPISELWIVAGYAGLQWILASGFLIARRAGRRPWLFRLALVAAARAARIGPLAADGRAGMAPRVPWALVCHAPQHRRPDLRRRRPRDRAPPRGVPELSPVLPDDLRRSDRSLSALPADWARERSRAEFLQDLDHGVHRIFRGFLYKFILAALVRQYWLRPPAHTAGLAGGVSYMYAYACTCSSTSPDTARSRSDSATCSASTLPENFRRPFLAPNIREFWNRWHISLSWWLRDHVYMRFVMAATKGGWFSSQHVASHVGIVLAMGLMGLWHGAQWQYVLYGLYQAALLVGHDVFARRIAGRLPRLPVAVRRPVAILITFHAVAFGFLIFSGRLTGGSIP